MKKKLKNSGGMTFVELLCAAVILILLCIMTNTGLNMALSSYMKLTAQAETQLLMDSLMDAITDKLRYCVVTKKISGGDVEYVNSVGEVDLNSDKQVTMGGESLLPDGAYGNDEAWGAKRKYEVKKVEVKSNYEQDDYDESRPVFTVTLEVTGAPKATEGIEAITKDFTVQCLNPLKIEKTEEGGGTTP